MSSLNSKTDNHNLNAKLALRRSFLSEYPGNTKLSVCDCFSGEQESIWTILRKEFNVSEYLALDTKQKDRRLKLDSLRYLQNQRWTHNVIDLDAYGSPWRHWFEVLRRGLACTVFLTVGNTMFKQQQQEALAKVGIRFSIPGGLHSGLAELVTDYCLGDCLLKFQVLRAAEALNPGGSARYLAVRLVKNDK